MFLVSLVCLSVCGHYSKYSGGIPDRGAGNDPNFFFFFFFFFGGVGGGEEVVFHHQGSTFLQWAIWE